MRKATYRLVYLDAPARCPLTSFNPTVVDPVAPLWSIVAGERPFWFAARRSGLWQPSHRAAGTFLCGKKGEAGGAYFTVVELLENKGTI